MKKYVLGVLISCFLLLPSNVLAIVCNTENKYQAEVNIDKSTINMNEKAFISVKSNESFQVEYESNDKSVATVSKEGIVSAVKYGKTNISIKINFLDNEEVKGVCNTNLEIQVISNDSTLKSLELEEMKIEGFAPDKTEYNISVPYNYDKVNIIAVPNTSDAKISGSGRQYLNEGLNILDVVVTALDGSNTTYKLNITREAANNDTTLKSLNIEGYVIEPKFQSDIYKYNLSIDKNIEKIKINATPNNEFAEVTGTGTHTLATGDNSFIITVKAQNGDTNKYEVIVYKNKGTSKLNSLEIKDYQLEEKFIQDNYTYHVTINNNIDKLAINATANEEDNIEIIGNENLKVGTNEIFIRVTSKDKTTTTYKIIAQKLNKEAEEIIKKNNTLLKILFIIFVISIVIMVIVVSIFIKKYFSKSIKIKKIDKKNKKKRKK